MGAVEPPAGQESAAAQASGQDRDGPAAAQASGQDRDEPAAIRGSAQESGQPPAIRASDQDRDEAARRLQAAFAEGRLGDAEFDVRMRAALTAVTRPELGTLTADLPATPADARPAAPRDPGGYAVAYKNSVRRGGRWRVPGRFMPVVYKGSGWIDLRAAELTEPVTTIVAVAYKSRIDILVPPGVRVELDGFGVSKGWSAQEEWESLLPPDAPVVHIRGVAYKGTIEASTRPPAAGISR